LGLRTISDLARRGVRIINREPGSGTRHYLEQEFAGLGVDTEHIGGYEESVAMHLEVALKTLRREADAGIATRAAARLIGLDFIPLTEERFDIVVATERFFSPGIKTLLDPVASREFRSRVEALGGYDTSDAGRIAAN